MKGRVDDMNGAFGMGVRTLKSVLFLGLFFVAGQAMAGTYYASPTGSKSGAGTIGNPWDITKACTASVLQYGDVVKMRGGVYPNSDNFSMNGGYHFVMMPQVDGVTYRSYEGEWAVIRGGTQAGPLSTIGLAADDLTFDSIEVRWGGHFGIGWFGRSNGIVIQNCKFDSTPHPNADQGDNAGCISTNTDDGYMDGWRIENNEFRNIGARGAVHSYGMDRSVVRNNRFYGISNGWGAIFLKTGRFGNRDNLWEYNVIHSTGGGMSMGVHCNGVVSNLTIRNNIVYGNSYSLLQLSYAECFQAPIDFDSIFVYNNTFDASSLGSGNAVIRNEHGNSPPQEDMDNFWIFNNLIYRHPSSRGVRSENYANNGSYAQFGDNWYSNYNAYVLRNSSDNIYSWRRSGGSYDNYTLSQWQANAGSLNSTYTGDPNSFTITGGTDIFINAGGRDYALNPSGASYFSLSTAGRGNGYPEYIGALAPGALEPDSTDPVVSGTADSAMTGCGGYIRWITDEPATSMVDYGLTPSYELGTVSSSALVYAHSVQLSGLNPQTAYYYRARSRDIWGNEGQSGQRTAVTTNEGCNEALGILPSVSATYPGYSEFRITDGVINAYGAESSTWASDDGTSTADWITVDFGSPIDVSNVTIHWAWNAFASAWTTSQEFRIQYWNGSSYTNLQIVTGAPASPTTSTNVPTTSTSRIRVRQPTGLGPLDYPGILWLTEVEVFNSVSADSIPPNAITDVR